MSGRGKKASPSHVRSLVGDIMCVVGRGPWPHAVRRFAGPEGMHPKYPCLPNGPWPLNNMMDKVVFEIEVAMGRYDDDILYPERG